MHIGIEIGGLMQSADMQLSRRFKPAKMLLCFVFSIEINGICGMAQ